MSDKQLRGGSYRVYEEVLDYIQDTGRLPFQRDIAARLELSRSHLSMCATALRQQGLLAPREETGMDRLEPSRSAFLFEDSVYKRVRYHAEGG